MRPFKRNWLSVYYRLLFQLQAGVLEARFPVAGLEIADCQNGLIGTSIELSVHSTAFRLCAEMWRSVRIQSKTFPVEGKRTQPEESRLDS